MARKIAVDFDGTCVMHEYPKVGADCPDAVRVLKKLVDNGDKLILYTMRSSQGLRDAINWFSDRGIYLHGIQKDPGQHEWTRSNKCYAQIYIDDAALGCPLVHPKGKRPYVDWNEVERLLEMI